MTLTKKLLPPQIHALEGLRVVMLCDDTQIDRRILHEAESLAEQGSEVIVLGRMAEGFAACEMDGRIKIERIEYNSVIQARRMRETMLHEMAKYQSKHHAQELEKAANEVQQQFSSTFIGPNYGSPTVERWILRQGWLLRNLLKMLMWPPMRLDALRRYAPKMPLILQYAIYLPSLALTPRPLALRWHWHRLLPHLARWFPRWFGENSRAKIRARARANARALHQQIIRFDDMNMWELALYDRGCFLRPDIVHVHDLPQLRPAYHISQTLGVPVIYDAHEIYPSIHSLSDDQKQRLFATEAHYIQHVQKAITVNPFFAKHQAKDYRIEAPEVLLNATTIPDGFIRGKKSTRLRDALGVAEGDKILLFQGWITAHRCIAELIEAMGHVPSHIHLALMGYGDEIPQFQALAKKLGLEKRVHFPAPVPQKELLDWVSSADAGIIPYQAVDPLYRYCSPNKLFEFIAAALPIIANDLPYLRQVIDDGKFGILHPLYTPKDYAEAIRNMFSAPEGDERRFINNLIANAEPYLWPAQEKTLLRIYRDVLEAWKKPAVSESPAEVLPFTTYERPKTLSSDTPLRVFHGPYNTAGIPTIMARAERALGLDSKAVCFPSGFFQYQPDIVLEHTTNPADILARFRTYADAFDVFVFHFGTSLANDSLADVPLLKQMGKKVIFYFHGCDIRQSKETIRKYEFSACKECWPQRCSRNRDTALDMAMRYADAVWVSTPDMLEFVPGAELFLQPLDIASHPFYPRSEHAGKVRMIHAPSDRQLKGSGYIESAVKQLQQQGANIELILLEGLANDALKEQFNRADFAIDQLLFGSYGMMAVELMASGVPVICYIRDDVLANYPEAPPIMRATPHTVGQTIEAMLAARDTWQDIANRGREYVLRHHSADAAATRALATYRRLQNDQKAAA